MDIFNDINKISIFKHSFRFYEILIKCLFVIITHGSILRHRLFLGNFLLNLIRIFPQQICLNTAPKNSPGVNVNYLPMNWYNRKSCELYRYPNGPFGLVCCPPVFLATFNTPTVSIFPIPFHNSRDKSSVEQKHRRVQNRHVNQLIKGSFCEPRSKFRLPPKYFIIPAINNSSKATLIKCLETGDADGP